MHDIEPGSDPCHHPMLKTRRSLAQSHGPQPRMRQLKMMCLGHDGALDHGVEVGCQLGVCFEAEKRVALAPWGFADDMVTSCLRQPDLAIAKAGDGWNAAIDRTPALPPQRHLALDAT